MGNTLPRQAGYSVTGRSHINNRKGKFLLLSPAYLYSATMSMLPGNSLDQAQGVICPPIKFSLSTVDLFRVGIINVGQE